MTRPDHKLLRALKDERNQLKRENEELTEELDHVWGVIGRINEWDWGSLSPDRQRALEVLNHGILELALFTVRSSNGSLLLYDDRQEELVFVTVIGESEDTLVKYRIPGDAGIAGWVATNKRPALVPNVKMDDRWLPTVDQSIGFLTKCLMAVPIMMGERVFGVLEVVNSNTEDPFRKSDLELLKLIGKISSSLYAGLNL